MIGSVLVASAPAAVDVVGEVGVVVAALTPVFMLKTIFFGYNRGMGIGEIYPVVTLALAVASVILNVLD